MRFLLRAHRGARRDEGQILPVLLTAIIAILAITMLLMQVGRAGLLRTKTKTAADAAALAAVQVIDHQWRTLLMGGGIPWYQSANEEGVRQAAEDYAKKNGGELKDFELTRGLGQWVVHVKTRSQNKQGGDLEDVKDKKANAAAYATITFPDCVRRPKADDGKGLYACGDNAVSWSFVADRIDTHLTGDFPDTFYSGVTDPSAMGEKITREEVVKRAKSWRHAYHGHNVPYSMRDYFPGPGGKKYRTDCSGFVSMAWHLPSSLTTTTLHAVAHRIDKSQLKRGDILLNSNGAGPASHVIMFLGWANEKHTRYKGIEQRGHDGTVLTPSITYSYFHGSTAYIPYRYDKIQDNPSSDASGKDKDSKRG